MFFVAKDGCVQFLVGFFVVDLVVLVFGSFFSWLDVFIFSAPLFLIKTLYTIAECLVFKIQKNGSSHCVKNELPCLIC